MKLIRNKREIYEIMNNELKEENKTLYIYNKYQESKYDFYLYTLLEIIYMYQEIDNMTKEQIEINIHTLENKKNDLIIEEKYNYSLKEKLINLNYEIDKLILKLKSRGD